MTAAAAARTVAVDYLVHLRQFVVAVAFVAAGKGAASSGSQSHVAAAAAVVAAGSSDGATVACDIHSELLPDQVVACSQPQPHRP